MSAEYGIEDYQEFLKDLRDVPENYDSLTEPQREFSDLASSVGSWSAICGCVKPYISIDEWLSLDEDTITALGDAVKELNPHWFEMPDTEKKTDETQMTFTPN
jgi:hypothetical protein